MADARSYILGLLSPGSRGLEVSGANVVGSGADSTTDWLLHSYIKPILAAETVDQLATACTKVRQGLLYQGPYQDVQLSLEPAESKYEIQSLLAHVQLDAAKRFTLQTGTNVGNTEGYGYIKGTTRNYFGLGEILTLDTHMGTRTKQSHLFTCSVPGVVVGLPIDWKIEGLGYASSKVADWAHHKQQVRGATLRCSHLLHSFGVDGVLRTLYSQSPKTVQSPTFIEQAGHAFKLSAFLNYKQDTRDDQFLPSRGSMLHIATELATGDHPMAKVSLDYQQGFTLHPKLIGSIGARLGHLQPLTTSHLMDRFYMGGPLDVRGFKMYRGSPHEGSLSVGGNQVAAFGGSLFTPVADKLYVHLFANGGGIGNNLAQLARPRVSAGFGIVYNHPISRFELNIAMPLVAHAHDGVSKGLQFGVGMSYL